MTTTVFTLLEQASRHLRQRGQQYDQPEGERSMGRTVRAFNAVTGHTLTEAEGWMLMALLKMVRDQQRDKPHQDSCEDMVAYAALYGESRLSEVVL